MKYLSSPLLLLVTTFFLSGCLYDSAPSQPASQLNTWLAGSWITQDKSGKIFEAVVTPQTNTRYHVTVCNKDKNAAHPWEFDGWISRVGDVKFLTLCSLSNDPRYHGKYLFFHYELIRPKTPPLDGIGERRMRLIEPQLPTSARFLDSYHLRQAIRLALRHGSLLVPKGSSVWTRTGDVILPKTAY